MTADVDATKRPWTFLPFTEHTGGEIRDTNGHLMVQDVPDDLGPLIVRSVNSHEKLREALEPFARALTRFERAKDEGDVRSWTEWIENHWWPSQKECNAARAVLSLSGDMME